MTPNQRRPGFRLPWSSETDAAAAEDGSRAPATDGFPSTAAPPAPFGPSTPAERPELRESPEVPEAVKATEPPRAHAVDAPVAAAAAPAAAQPSEVAEVPSNEEEPAAPGEPRSTAVARADAEGAAGNEFMRDLVAAMRRVAEDAREAGVTELRARAEDHVRKLELEAERRRDELRARAEADVAGVGEWASAEAERIKAEAEQRVVTRRAQLEEQLAGDTARTESETKAMRDRVAEYERELEAYHAQLAEINDPAAFAAAAKRMPPPPPLALAEKSEAPSTAPAVTPRPKAPAEPAAGPSNGVAAGAGEVHPAEEEVLAARLAELDATLPEPGAKIDAPSAAGEPATTEVVVKGLGSFGAITGFRQALSGVDGIEGVALSLGQTGEFVFRATHAAGFDVRSAIAQLEGDGAKIEDRAEGGLRVTLDRAR